MIPVDTNPIMCTVIEKCWADDARIRPNFEEILAILQRTLLPEEFPTFGKHMTSIVEE